MHSPEDQPLLPERRLVLRAAAVLGMSAVLGGCATERPDSKRIAIEPSETMTPTEETVPPTPEVAPSASSIAAARPHRLIIPPLNFEGTVDSAIRPVKVPHRGNDVYYNPPTDNLIYWAEGCSLPASPSEGTTYLFGHSDVSHVVGGAVFDRLPDLEPRDKIELTTALGRFAYRVTKNLSIPYDELANHTDTGDFGDGSVKNRLVLVTCRVPDAELDVVGYNTVICADQEEALPI